jgi:hypothetical protein
MLGSFIRSDVIRSDVIRSVFIRSDVICPDALRSVIIRSVGESFYGFSRVQVEQNHWFGRFSLQAQQIFSFE